MPHHSADDSADEPNSQTKPGANFALQHVSVESDYRRGAGYVAHACGWSRGLPVEPCVAQMLRIQNPAKRQSIQHVCTIRAMWRTKLDDLHCSHRRGRHFRWHSDATVRFFNEFHASATGHATTTSFLREPCTGIQKHEHETHAI